MPGLTGVGERADEITPDTNLSTHIQDVVGVLEQDNLRGVILIGHSYGGMVITGVADRAGERIKELVYIKAPHPRDGEALADTFPGLRAHFTTEKQSIGGVDCVMIPSRSMVMHLGVKDDETIDWILARLTPHPYKAVMEKLYLRDEKAVLAIPRTAIDSASLLASRPPEIEARIRSSHRSWQIDAEQDVLITAPDQVTAMLLKLAS
jgi:pimeloyl-ACP methyl ester carboxylesterase